MAGAVQVEANLQEQDNINLYSPFRVAKKQ